MTKFAVVAVLAFGTLTAPVFAADLIVDEAPAIAAPLASGLYLQLLGGASLPGTLEYFEFDVQDSEDDVPAGGAVAGVVGFSTGIDGLSIEGDAFLTQRDYLDGDFTLTTGTLMAALKYTAALTDTFSVYGAVGLGGVHMHDEENGAAVIVDGWGAGYLLKAGVTAEVAQNVALVGEVRYSNTFSPIDTEFDDQSEQIGTAAVLAGVQIGF